MDIVGGTRLGPYEVGALIGAGGMGTVYRARDTRLNRDVAIKVLSHGPSSHPQMRERFSREARSISSLSHPNICPLYDVGSTDGIDYLVMELLEGESLSSRLQRGTLLVGQAVALGIDIALALDAAHRAGIVHRDLKPGNIMLTRSGARLLDFGLAKMTEAAAESDSTTMQAPLTREGMVVGTLQYMAPEQLEGKPADSRTDIFALGLVLYEMLAGRHAFDGTSP
ncbi:MAG TPA: serine/threonine-protein kinase, partial [Thermoanaerobaculia bacterium]|nr:serine/threonine-protein kinase [Thermoanaerobaculia bacterium]